MVTVVFLGTNFTEADSNASVEETSNLFLPFNKDKEIPLFFLQGELLTDSILKGRLQQILLNKKEETHYACMSRSLLMRMRNKLISSIYFNLLCAGDLTIIQYIVYSMLTRDGSTGGGREGNCPP